MAGVTIGYKGSTIATIQGGGSKTLKTAGKYCEGDIFVDYVQEGGGGITPTGTKSITANGTYDVTAFASAEVNVPPVGASNVYSTTVTIATHSSTNVSLCTLPDDVYAHKDDSSFTVTLINTTPEAVLQYDEYYVTASNNSNLPKQGTYPVYGIMLRKTGATTVGNNPCYYPPNSSNNNISLGGYGKIWMSGKNLMYKSNSYYFGAGTYRILVSW